MTTPSGSPRAASSALAIKVRELSVVLGSSLILDDVSLAVGGGESVAILGANGSGKSTLVKAVLGLVPLSGGSIELLGTPTSRRHRVPWERIGYVPQRIGAGSGVPATALEVVRSGLLGPRRPLAHRGRAAKRKAMSRSSPAGRPSGSSSPGPWSAPPSCSSSMSPWPASTAPAASPWPRSFRDCARRG